MGSCSTSATDLSAHPIWELLGYLTDRFDCINPKISVQIKFYMFLSSVCGTVEQAEALGFWQPKDVEDLERIHTQKNPCPNLNARGLVC